MRTVARARGFSLIEVMIALVISSLLLAGLVTTFTNANQSYTELTKTSRQIENGRYAMSVLDADVRHAGFYGEYTGKLAVSDPKDPPPVSPVPQPCVDEPADFLAGLRVPVYGYDGAAAPPLACLDNYLPNTDVLVIRRVSTEAWDRALKPLDPTRIYFQGWLDSPTAKKGPYLDYGTGPFDVLYPDDATPVPVRQFLEHIFYLAKCRNCAGGGDNIPTLTRLDYLGHGRFNAVPLAEGIEDMRIRYGADTSGLFTGAPGDYQKAGALTIGVEWPRVVAVEISLLARNSQTSRNYTDQKIYTLGGVAVGPFKDEFRRHAFSQVVRVVNSASKMEDFRPSGTGINGPAAAIVVGP